MKEIVRHIIGSFPGGSAVKNPRVMQDTWQEPQIPGSGRSPGGGNGNLLQYSCLENPRDKGVWQAAVHGVTKEPDMTEHAHTLTSVLHTVTSMCCILSITVCIILK